MAEISGHIPLLSVTGRLFIEGEGRVNPGERTDRASLSAAGMSTVFRPAGRLFAGLRDRFFVVRRAARLFDFKTAHTSSRRHPKLRPVVVCGPHCLRPREPQVARLRRSDGPTPGLFAAPRVPTAASVRRLSHLTSRPSKSSLHQFVVPTTSKTTGPLSLFHAAEAGFRGPKIEI